ncbi:MAG: type IV pilus secretin PilQ, partial [Deltaproteobacteria bacterium]|nr:type IV pilus secretin PilQ [Deltaproteobacteria bacterium]
AARAPAVPPVAVPRGPRVAVPVRAIDFVDEPARETVIIAVGGSVEYRLTRAPRRAVLRLDGAVLARGLERTLDTTAFLGPVRSVTALRDGAAVQVVVELADEVQTRVRRDGGRLLWDFVKAEGAAPSEARVKVPGTREIPPPRFSPAGDPPAAAARERRGKRRYSGKRIDLDFKDADIQNILRLLADIGQVNVITGEDVKGSVTIRMRNVPWDQALDVILRAKGLGMIREGNLVRVAPAAVLEKEREAEAKLRRQAVEVAPLETRLVPISYADAPKILAQVKELASPRGRLSIDDRTNTLIVTDVRANLNLIEELVRNLDTQTPQVLIEARIVEARSTFTRDIGIQWGGNYLAASATGIPTGLVFPSTLGMSGSSATPDTAMPGIPLAMSPNYAVSLPAPVGLGSGGAIGFTLGSVSGALNLNLRLSAQETSGNVRIVAAPRVTTLDNVEAIIEQGVSIPISQVSAAGVNTVFADAKLTLQVKPHITSDGNVMMKIMVTKNEADFVNTGARGDPTILRKQAKTEMLVRDGDTAVIGGIYTRNTGLSWKKVPFLADIPIIGWAFKSRREADERTEMLIFITPRIVNRARSLGQ